MCGIVGIFNPLPDKNQTTEIIKRMAKIISHRGPDASGFFVDKNIALGHNRLSIIDLSQSANQPMTDINKRFVIIYNGEIYNFKELKQELKEKKYIFKTQSDTEVILYSFVEWGADCFIKFNGMFALSIWDKKEKKLVLARDKYGIKPFYYWENGRKLYFASEIKSFLTIPEFKTAINKQALQEYLVFQNYLSSETIFKGVYMLPTASFMTIKKNKRKIKKYWNFKFTPDYHKSENEWIDETKNALNKVITKQLTSDVPVGAYLSSGIDSNIITAIASKTIKKMPTFTCGFRSNKDERDSAKKASKFYNTKYKELIIKADDLNILKDYIWHIEEPRMSFGYQNFLLAKFASKNVKVVLSGTGGDELFAGYPWRHKTALSAKNRKEFDLNYFNVWQKVFKEKELKSILIKEYAPKKNYLKNKFISFIKQVNTDEFLNEKEKYLAETFYFELNIFLNGFLVVEDKLSMAHALETRVPLLDDELVDISLKMPPFIKIDQERINENLSGKKIIRKAAKEILPDFIISAKKQGFVPPANWLIKDQKKIIKNYMDNLKKRDIIKPLAIDSIIKNINVDINSNGRKIWSLVCLEQWCQLFLDGEGVKIYG